MEPNELLSVSPEFLAKAIIHRRERLLELIPSELEQAQALQMEAEQNSRNAKQSRDEINQKVANLKKERNHAQNEAKQLFEEAAKARDELIEKGEMKTPEPKWAKDKLSNKIQRIEEKILTEWKETDQCKSKKDMLNYFMKHRLKNLMEVIEEF